MAKKKGKGKALIFGFLILAICTVGALGILGIIPIPGLSPKKNKGALALYGQGMYNQGMLGTKAEKPVAKRETPKPKDSQAKPVVKKTEAPKTDPSQGQKKLAKLWNEMEIDKLVAIVANWKDEELAPVLNRMDPEKASQLLASLKPDRASKLSKAIQTEAAKLVTLN